MGRPASGREFLARAKDLLLKAKTAEEIRLAQALILPLEYGFSLEQVAAVTGISRGWVCQLRRRFIRNGGEIAQVTASSHGGRRRENMSLEEETAFLAPFFESARCGGVLVANVIHVALEQHLGRKVALASAYNLLHRHGWRKLAPDKRNVDADLQVQKEWKKTPL